MTKIFCYSLPPVSNYGRSGSVKKLLFSQLVIENNERYVNNQLVLPKCLVQLTPANIRMFVRNLNYPENNKKLQKVEVIAQCKLQTVVKSTQLKPELVRSKYLGTTREKGQFRAVCHNYIDIFLLLGRLRVIQHGINTGNSLSIR